MARPRTPVGELGAIAFERTADGWVARGRVRLPGGNTYRPKARGATKSLAEAALRKRVEREARHADDEFGEDPALRDLIALYEGGALHRDRRRGGGPLSEVTKDAYRYQLRRIEALAGGLRASECTVRRLEKVLFAPDACKASQAKQRLSVLRAVFAEAVRLDVVDANPAREVQVDQYKSQAVDDRGEPRMFTPDEVDRLLAISRAFDATPHRGAKRSLRTYPLLAVLLGSGLRMGEALALRWSSFDPARSRLVVERSITITMSSRMIEKKPKSRQGERSVSIPRWTRDALIEYLGEQDQRSVGRDDLMFPNRDGRYLNPHNARRTLRKMVEGTELKGLPPAQTSRRTVGTAIDRTHGSEAAAAHLGNSRVVALSHYIANDKERPDFSSALEGIGPGRVREEPSQNVDPEWD